MKQKIYPRDDVLPLFSKYLTGNGDAMSLSSGETVCQQSVQALNPDPQLLDPDPQPLEPDPELLRLASGAPPSNIVNRWPTYDTQKLKLVCISFSTMKSEMRILQKGMRLMSFEKKLLSRLLYKHHNRFRNDRGYKALRILEKSVMKLESGFPEHLLDNLSGLMPIGVPESGGQPYLPPTAIAQYTGLHLWLALALLDRIEFCCRSAGIYAMQRLALGHFWGMGAYHLAVVSRIWVLARHVGQSVVRVRDCVEVIARNLPGKSLYSASVVTKIFSTTPAWVHTQSQISAPISHQDSFDVGKKLKRPNRNVKNEEKTAEDPDINDMNTEYKSVQPVEEKNGKQNESSTNSIEQETISKGPSVKNKLKRKMPKPAVESEDDNMFLLKAKIKTSDSDKVSKLTKEPDEKVLISKAEEKMKASTASIELKISEISKSTKASDDKVLASKAKKKKKELNDSDKVQISKTTLTSTEPSTSTDVVGLISQDRLGELHSLDDLKAFLAGETDQRKQARRDALTRRLSQTEWKELKCATLAAFNPRLPNKSIKLCRRMIRQAIVDTANKV